MSGMAGDYVDGTLSYVIIIIIIIIIITDSENQNKTCKLNPHIFD